MHATLYITRHYVGPSICPSIRWSIGPSVRQSVDPLLLLTKSHTTSAHLHATKAVFFFSAQRRSERGKRIPAVAILERRLHNEDQQEYLDFVHHATEVGVSPERLQSFLDRNSTATTSMSGGITVEQVTVVVCPAFGEVSIGTKHEDEETGEFEQDLLSGTFLTDDDHPIHVYVSSQGQYGVRTRLACLGGYEMYPPLHSNKRSTTNMSLVSLARVASIEARSSLWLRPLCLKYGVDPIVFDTEFFPSLAIIAAPDCNASLRAAFQKEIDDLIHFLYPYQWTNDNIAIALPKPRCLEVQTRISMLFSNLRSAAAEMSNSLLDFDGYPA